MVEIKEVNFQFSGLEANEGGKLGQDIMQQVLNNLPNNFSTQQIAQLNLRVALPVSVGRSQWASHISNEIIKKIINTNR